MKKILSLIFTVVAVTVMVACNKEANQLEFANSENVMAFQALTSVQVVENEPVGETPIVVVPEENEQDNPEVIVTDEQVEAIEEVSPYISMFENLLSQKDGLIEEVKDSDLEDYEHMQVFKIPNILGGSEKSILYYNIISLDRDEDDEDDEDDEEIEFTFTGIIVKGENTYNVFGKQEIEDDEFELEFVTKIDDENYVISKYEKESEELEFEYEVYQNGKKTKEFKLEIEAEDDELEIELEYKSNGVSGKYQFELETKNGKDVLKVEFQTVVDGNQTKGSAYYHVTYDENNNPIYEVIFTSESK